MNPNPRKALRLCFALLGMLCIASLPVRALNPALPPSGNFDLTHWNITLPVDSSGGFSGTAITVDTATLSSGYTYAPYFYTASTDGAMTFEVPYNGAISGTSGHPRSELRECLPSGALYNWLPNDPTGTTHILDATCIPDTASIGTGGYISIGQVHGKVPNIPAIILRYYATGRVMATVKNSPNDAVTQTTYEFGNFGANPTLNYSLQIVGDAAGNVDAYLTVNGVTIHDAMSAHDSAWATTTFYFKAGLYNVAPVTGMTARLAFYDLVPIHSTGAPSAPTITTSALPNGRTTVGYGNQQLMATGGTPPYTWSLDSGTLPAGLSLSGGGVISGTPTTVETSSFTVRATDAAAQSGNKPLSIVVNANSIPAITTTTLPGATVGTAYNQTVSSTGGDVSAAWSVLSGALPPGITLGNINQPNSTLSGTPTTAGTYNFTLQVADIDNDVDTQAFSLVVGAAAVPAAPSSLTGTPAKRKVLLAWTDNAANESGFKIERSTDGTTFTQITTVAANTTSYTNTGLNSGTTYWYRVRAYNGTGDSAYSNVASATAK